jgi:hypothetical protein
MTRFIRPLTMATLALCMLSAWTPSHARSLFWPFRWDDHQFRHRHQHKHTKSGPTKDSQFKDAARGPLEIIISIADQRISLYENGTLIARSSVSTGVEGHPTPLGVFSVLSKQKWHRSNIYSAAPMPYMQRLTWSGIALHAGQLPGYPASHGCIRVTNDFAIRLWHLTKRGTRVIIAREDIRPIEIADPRLFVPKPRVAPASPGSGTAALASDGSITGATADAPPMPSSHEDAKTVNPASTGARAHKVVPISVFVSRQLSKLFVRKGFTPLFNVPIKIRDPAEPIGTHVFTAMKFENEGTATRWTVVSIPEKSLNQGNPPRLRKEPAIPIKANAVLERIEMPQDAVDRISELLTPGSSLIISDYGISQETGADTDFIVLTH